MLTRVVALLLLVSTPAAAQWTPAKAPWGDPDLQGNFTNKDETAPFERPITGVPTRR
jgi:hypothetical protein